MKKIIIYLFVLTLISACNLGKENSKVTACFNYYPTENKAGEVKFENCSTNATDYLWSFGDGHTSTKKNPVYTFQKHFPYKVTLKAYNEEYSDTITHDVSDVILIKKPNIYLYPQKQIDICLSIEFPKGGKVVKSIPVYSKGWCVSVNESGKIDGEYDYLFYESEQTNMFQLEKGWCIDQYELTSFFEKNMKDYNFSKSEINDFIEYWIPKMDKTPYYVIYPQTKEIINKSNQLKFSIEPDNIFRLFYFIEESEKYRKIDKPTITPIERKGFHVVEWGVMGI